MARKDDKHYRMEIQCETPYHEQHDTPGEIRLLQAILLQAFLDLSRASHGACNLGEKFQAVKFLLSTRGEWAKARLRIAGMAGKWSAESIRNHAIRILGSDDIMVAYKKSLNGFYGGSFALTGGMSRHSSKVTSLRVRHKKAANKQDIQDKAG
jgi:hypothetical protein